MLVELSRALDQYGLDSSFSSNGKESQTILDWDTASAYGLQMAQTLFIDCHFPLKVDLKLCLKTVLQNP